MEQSHPSGDKRFKILEATMKKHQLQQGALIEVLHAAQELFGYLEPDLLYFVARGMKLPPSKVYGVATFYHLFSFQPKGLHTCVVCTGTACYVMRAGELLKAAESAAGIKNGETSADGRLSLSTARCLGACGMAPVVVLDGGMKGHESVQELLYQVKGWLARGPARSA